MMKMTLCFASPIKTKNKTGLRCFLSLFVSVQTQTKMAALSPPGSGPRHLPLASQREAVPPLLADPCPSSNNSSSLMKRTSSRLQMETLRQ